MLHGAPVDDLADGAAPLAARMADYQLQGRLGSTAGSSLYRARRLADQAPYLFKVLEPEQATPGQLAHFQHEYALLQALRLPGVIRPLALFTDSTHYAMSLEDFPGELLEALLVRQGRLDLPACLAISRHLAAALAGLADAQVIHHDLRPANILVNPQDGRACLADVSLAATLIDELASTASLSTAIGDLAYCSPEQTGRMNRPVDYRTDFYSLGVTLYRMLTGRLPFEADDPLEWVHCHIARQARAPSEVNPAIPPVVSELVMKLLAKLPEERYQSAHGLQADLDWCLAQWQSGAQVDWFALGAEDFSDRFQIPHKLYGRDRERASLLATFDQVAVTGEPVLVTVSGYSGIGKSTLVGELQKPIVEKHGYFISGKFDQFMRDIPYATLAQAFRELVQQLLAESDARIALWRQQIEEAVGALGQLVVDILPQIELIIGKQAPVPDLPPTEAQNRFRMVFQKFMAVFARAEHPLVLFVDDLQWIDAASLQLIEYLLTYPDMRYLLLIGAYRDNEVSAAHPLMASLDAIRHSATGVTDIKLAPLALPHLNQLVADTLHAEAASCEPLTRVVFERTAGNPFFFIQFLDALHKDGLLQFDVPSRAWQWNLDSIKARDFADNIVDLMIAKLRRLPVETQQALQLAACLGNQFDLHNLALVSGQSEAENGQRLAAAMRQGLVMRVDGNWKFLHDRIQQAAYALIPEEERAALHLHIGRLLSADTAPEEAGENLFEIVNQLNRGAMLITAPEERQRVARFNLAAGMRAKTSTAYASALAYLAAGRALLAEDSWERQYALTFALEFHRAECEYLSAELAAAEDRLAMLARRAANLGDRAVVAGARVNLYTTLDRSDRSVDVCLDYLRCIGVQWSSHPTEDQVRQEHERLWRQIGNRAVEELVDLPLMSDPEWRATMDVLTSAIVPALFTDEKLCVMIAGRMANISLEHGNSDGSCLAYAWLGTILGPRFGDYRTAFRFGKLGVDLVEQRGLDRYKARVYLIFGSMVNPWTKPIRSGRALVRRAFDAGIESGDLTFAAYSWIHVVTTCLVCADPLGETQQVAEDGLAFARKVRFGFVVDISTAQLMLIRTLRGLTPSLSSFNDGEFDESRFEQHLEGEPALALPACWYWIRKLQARFYAGDYACAIESAIKAQPLLWTSPSLLEMVEYHFYAALAWAAHCDVAAADERPQHLKAIQAHHQQLEVWAENCPENFRNRAALVGAEIARVEGRNADAMRLYEQAIEAARENGFTQNQGLAHELAAGFYLARGLMTAGKAHLQAARGCYVDWGADGKVRQLEARYPALLERPAPVPATAWRSGAGQLDFLSVAKASQAISGEIVLDRLIDKLMRVVLESASAQKGYLLLARPAGLTLAAEAQVDQTNITVRYHRTPAAAESLLPTAIFNFVSRTRDRVLLANATEPNPFSADAYLIQERPCSVLCLPIVRQAGLIGVLYLEHKLAANVFTSERLAVLEVLASQAAISLENATLYRDLQEENSERKRAEDALLERNALIRRLVESNIIGIFFWDLAGNISDANDAMLQITGYSREDLLAGKIKWTSMSSPEYRAADELALAELAQRGTCSPYEKEYIRKDGRRIPVLNGAALLEGAQGNGVAFVLDLTERKRGEAEREARQAAEAANRAKSQFLANMSHELRTPLNAILGYAQILQRDKSCSPRRASGLNTIYQSGEHLLTLINDVLDLSKIEAGKLELYPSAFNLPSFLQVIGDIIRIRAQQKSLGFRLEAIAPLPAAVRADEKRLRQVLLNLLGNAVKFTDRGEVVLRVQQVSRSATQARLRFEVSDTGIGIAPDQREAIFRPFEQVGDVQRRFGGTGLGLTISRQFIRMMDSELQVESEVGRGSCFRFVLTLPLEAELAVPAASGPVTGYLGRRRRLLIADDVLPNRAMLADLLSPLGFSIEEAADGQAALILAQTMRPDLIIMDMVMPVMDGLEAMRQLRQCADFQATPIIAVSASASDQDQARSVAAGASVFLAKPIEPDRLLQQIGELLGLAWMYEQAEAESAEPLAAPPRAELEALHALALAGNMRDILRWAGQLALQGETFQPFADKVRRLAEGYQSKSILALAEQHMSSSSTPSAVDAMRSDGKHEAYE